MQIDNIMRYSLKDTWFCLKFNINNLNFKKKETQETSLKKYINKKS